MMINMKTATKKSQIVVRDVNTKDARSLAATSKREKLEALKLQVIYFESCINNITITWTPKKGNTCKILVDIVEGGGSSGQERMEKLKFRFLLPLSSLIKNIYI